MGGSVTFFLTCIQIDQVKAIKEAYKAIAVLFLSSGILLAYKRKQKQEKREEEARKNIYDIQISRKGKTITCRGFYDSGNLLTSRITGQGVCIITQEKAREILMPKEQQEVKKILTDSSESLSWRMWAKQFQEGMYILQYSSVGKKNAKMPGVIAEQIVVLKNEEVLVKTKGMLGISQEKLVEQNTFSILLPADIFEKRKKSKYHLMEGKSMAVVLNASGVNRVRFTVINNMKSLFHPQREIHYIGGTDILPPPLEPEEEAYVLSQLDTKRSEEAKALLIERNLRLVVYIAKKFENTGIGVEDLISIGTIGLIKAIHTFKLDKKIKLATYASRCIENEILMYLRRTNKTKLEVSIDEPLNVDWDGNELLLSDILGTDNDVISKDIEDEIDRKMLNKAMEILSEREKLIIRLRFGIGGDGNEEKTQKEVADLLGISQSYISRLEKKIIHRLKREIIKME